jgi:copper resistance protein D
MGYRRGKWIGPRGADAQWSCHNAFGDPCTLHRINNAVHLLSAGVWLGALLPLILILAEFRVAGRGRAMRVIALWRFSRTGHLAVALVLITVAGNTAFVVGKWPLDWHSTYRRLLAMKIVLATAMTVLAVVNRYIIVPRLPQHRERALRVIKSNSIAEIAIGLFVVGLVAVFGTLDPR